MATKELPSTIFRTPVVRLSYPTLDKEQLARAQERVDRQRVTNPNIPDAKPGATLIFDARTRIDPTYKDRLTALVLAVANEAKSTWPKEEAEGPYLQNGAFHSPWHDGNLPKYKGNNGIEAGDWFIRPTSRRMILEALHRFAVFVIRRHPGGAVAFEQRPQGHEHLPRVGQGGGSALGGLRDPHSQPGPMQQALHAPQRRMIDQKAVRGPPGSAIDLLRIRSSICRCLVMGIGEAGRIVSKSCSTSGVLRATRDCGGKAGRSSCGLRTSKP